VRVQHNEHWNNAYLEHIYQLILNEKRTKNIELFNCFYVHRFSF
jgi:hypothetical protein